MKKVLLTSAVFLAFAGSAASAQIILYQDFTAGTPSTSVGLNGTAPGTDKLNTAGNLLSTSGGTAATWAAESAWTTTGSAASTNTSGASNAFLPFTPTLGHDYTLSATLSVSGLNWLALGFTSADSTTSFFYDGTNVNPAPWMLIEPGTSPTVNLYGSGTTPTASGSAFQGDTFTLTLDTFVNPATPWTYSLTATGPGITGTLALGNGIYATNPLIDYVGLGADVASGTVNGFTLTDTTAGVPEPSTYLMLGLGLIGLVILRRFCGTH